MRNGNFVPLVYMGIAIHSAFVEDVNSLEKVFLVTSVGQQNYFAHLECL